MRRILISSLFLSTVFLHAQAKTKGQKATLQALNEIASAPVAAAPEPASDASANIPARRITSGVTGPKLISRPTLTVSSADFPNQDLEAQHVVLSFRVDANGTPQNIHIVESVNQTVDERVMAAVRNSRYTPASLDGQDVPLDMNLVVNFQKQ